MAVATQPKRRSKWSRFLGSSVGKKYLTGLTGLALVLFVIVHLLGNFTLLVGAESFNTYAHFYAKLGSFLYVIEAGLAVFILAHAWIGLQIYLGKRRARPEPYARYKTVGGASKQTLSSRSMLVTGVVLFVFLVVHIATFRFGLAMAPVPDTLVDGEAARDLYRVVVDTFSNVWWVIGYETVMILLIFHLRHGIWSGLQSLAAVRPKASPMVYAAGAVIALALGIGFLILPIWIYVAQFAS